MPKPLAAAPGPASPQSPVPSPCVNVCRMAPSHGWCVGCWRSLDEIAAWSSLDDAAKQQVWAQLAQRRQAAQT